MKLRRIKAAAIVVLFLTAGVLYSANRSQDSFVFDNGFYVGEETDISGEGKQSGGLSGDVGLEISGVSESGYAETGDGQPDSPGVPTDAAASSGKTETGGQEISAQVHVHVCGAVKNAGVYLIPENSIVKDAIEAAGGVLEGGAVDYLNLAGTISEGDKIYVPYLKDVEDPYGAAQSSSGSGVQSGQDADKGQNALVNINTADSAQLMTLSGIGQTRADAIVAYRETNGNFQKIEDIMKVSGIKEGAFNKIKDRITV